MFLLNNSFLQIYIQEGSSLSPSFYNSYLNQKDILAQPEISDIKKLMGLNNLLTIKQIHSNQGFVVSRENLESLSNFRPEGDFLITNLKDVAIGAYVADCLPVILYDPINQAVGICHAGWSGSFKGVVIKVIEAMQENYGTNLKTLKVFLGPSAGVCCYEVKSDFIEKLHHSYADKVLCKSSPQIKFNLPLFNKLQLIELGIKEENIDDTANSCTICNLNFCSYRRDGAKAGRQLAIVILK